MASTYDSYYWIEQKTGTYSDVLETFGLAKLLNLISEKVHRKPKDFIIQDSGVGYYSVAPIIDEKELRDLKYFQVFKFIKKDSKTKIPESINDWFDYPKQKETRNYFREKESEITNDNSLSPDSKKHQIKKLREEQQSEFGGKLDKEFDVYREIVQNPYEAFLKVYENFSKYNKNFEELIKGMLRYYRTGELPSFKLDVNNKITSQQLFAPNQGKGLNRPKANNLSMGNIQMYWIQEAMKITGALEIMICQYVKVGSSFDLKVYVPDFKNIELNKAIEITNEFKRYLKSNTPVKLDILNILRFIERFIERSENYNERVKDTVKGLHAVYQKSLGQNRAVTNIAFYEIPSFIEYTNQEEGYQWLNFLYSQRKILEGIEERGDAINGLLNYRNFLSSADLTSFLDFMRWYATHLMQALSNNKYVAPFKTNCLNQIFFAMDNQNLNLKEIIENPGFQAVAKAIRKSTVSLQYSPPENRQYDIRYGMAQQLQNKRKSKEDLAAFIGDFIGTYNAETARVKEKAGKDAKVRANVKDEELKSFYELVDQYSPKLIASLLASYGFALTDKEEKSVSVEEEAQEVNDEKEL